MASKGLVYPWRVRGSWNIESYHARTWTREFCPTYKRLEGLCGPEEKEFFSSHYIVLLSFMQDDLLIEYEVYQIVHEMWEALKKSMVDFQLQS